MLNMLLLMPAGSQSPGIAHAWTILPLGTCTSPRDASGPSAKTPVSSWNSRLAASSGFSEPETSPLGMDQRVHPSWPRKGRPDEPGTAQVCRSWYDTSESRHYVLTCWTFLSLFPATDRNPSVARQQVRHRPRATNTTGPMSGKGYRSRRGESPERNSD